MSGWFRVGEFSRVLDSLHCLECLHRQESFHRQDCLQDLERLKTPRDSPFAAVSYCGTRPSCSATNKKTGLSTSPFICAQNGTRTHTPLPELGPEPSASTNSAIWALQKMQQGKYRPKGQRCQLHEAKMMYPYSHSYQLFSGVKGHRAIGYGREYPEGIRCHGCDRWQRPSCLHL